LGGRLVKHRGHHFAGAAPGGPEIHNHGKGVFFNVFSEPVAGQLQGFSLEQGGFTFPAPGVVRKLFGRDPVYGAALASNKRMGFFHDRLLFFGSFTPRKIRHHFAVVHTSRMDL
jgi:hypothetical protein